MNIVFKFPIYDVQELNAKRSGNPLGYSFSDGCNNKSVSFGAFIILAFPVFVVLLFLRWIFTKFLAFACLPIKVPNPPKTHGSYDDVPDLPIYSVHDLFYPYIIVDVRRPQLNVWYATHYFIHLPHSCMKFYL